MEPLSPEEIRVLGSLVEKSLSTPDHYPLTQNALMAACNQLSNRNPVVSYDENTVRLALGTLRAKQLARIIHIPGSRAPKHRHVLDEALELDRGEVALLGVLALRGAQTAGELRTRTERMHEFASLPEVEEVLARLAARSDPLVVRLERQPGQKEARFMHLLGGAEPAAAAATAPPPVEVAMLRAPAVETQLDRIAVLEARVVALEAQLSELRRQLGADEE